MKIEGKYKDNNNKKKREVDFSEYYIRFRRAALGKE